MSRSFRFWSLAIVVGCVVFAGWWAISNYALDPLPIPIDLAQSNARPTTLSYEWVRHDSEMLAIRNADTFAWTDVVAVIHVSGDREAYIKCATPRIVQPQETLQIALPDCARSLRSRVTYLAVGSFSIKAREGEHQGGFEPPFTLIDNRPTPGGR